MCVSVCMKFTGLGKECKCSQVLLSQCQDLVVHPVSPAALGSVLMAETASSDRVVTQH